MPTTPVFARPWPRFDGRHADGAGGVLLDHRDPGYSGVSRPRRTSADRITAGQRPCSTALTAAVLIIPRSRVRVPAAPPPRNHLSGEASGSRSRRATTTRLTHRGRTASAASSAPVRSGLGGRQLGGPGGACGACGTRTGGQAVCRECGSPLAQECPSCGSPVEPAAGSAVTAARSCRRRPGPRPPHRRRRQLSHAVVPQSERRLCSVLFCDLAVHAAVRARDPEEVRELLSRYFAAARTVVGRYGGVVEKFIGDAVMAVWGTPVATESDAERAVRAALDLIDTVHRSARSRHARPGCAAGS